MGNTAYFIHVSVVQLSDSIYAVTLICILTHSKVVKARVRRCDSCENLDAYGIKVCCKLKRIIYPITDSNSDGNGCLFKFTCNTVTWQFCKNKRETSFKMHALVTVTIYL